MFTSAPYASWAGIMQHDVKQLASCIVAQLNRMQLNFSKRWPTLTVTRTEQIDIQMIKNLIWAQRTSHFHHCLTGGSTKSFGVARARYDFSARDRSELSLQEGDTIKILSKKGHSGWWKGEVYGRVRKRPRRDNITRTCCGLLPDVNFCCLPGGFLSFQLCGRGRLGVLLMHPRARHDILDFRRNQLHRCLRMMSWSVWGGLVWIKVYFPSHFSTFNFLPK